jgi:hypothetical protein
MKKHSLPALSGAANGPASGVKDTVDGYEYLLRLRMDRVKATAVTDAEAAVVAARTAAAALRETAAAQLWLKDLEDFEAAWEKMVAVRLAASTGAPAKKVYKKATKTK